MSDNKKVILFASGYVGKKVLEFLAENYYDDIASLVLDANDTTFQESLRKGEKIYGIDSKYVFVYSKSKENELIEYLKNFKTDYFILAWWAYIISKEIIALPNVGVINFHPSLLPYNKGKHYNFWTIVEDSPFGVTLHFVDESIDTGDIIFQKTIEKTWEDNGQTLYFKAREEIINLFIAKYPFIREHKYRRIPQVKSEGSFHWGKELEQASQIDLDATYTARNLLNLLRARTFEGYPSCYFIENGEKYEVRINIKRVN